MTLILKKIFILGTYIFLSKNEKNNSHKHLWCTFRRLFNSKKRKQYLIIKLFFFFLKHTFRYMVFKAYIKVFVFLFLETHLNVKARNLDEDY